MATALEHYRDHLGPIYDWTLGDFAAAAARVEERLRAAGLGDGGGALAVDLGCGSGLQSLPLARLGHRVLAIDGCAPLLRRLEERAAGLPVRTVEDDLRRFRRHLEEPARVVVCMGDTLSHLPAREDVPALLADAARALAPRGRVVLGFRDLGTIPARFVPVRSDDARILTCVLEERGDRVLVHDLLHERRGGAWTTSVSSYEKLRLTAAAVRADVEAAGLRVLSSETAGGVVTLVGSAP